MWRAHVVQVDVPGWVVVTIPSLFGNALVGPIQSAVNAQAGEKVVVADLTPQHRNRDWWVVGYETQVGRWGEPYPHHHPMGEVTGLNTALADKADTAALTAKADAPGPWQACTLTAALSNVAAAGPLSARATPLGMQLRGRCRTETAVARDAVLFTLPAAFTPTVSVYAGVQAMESGVSDYAARTYQVELHPDRRVTARADYPTASWLSFNHLIVL